VHLQDTLSVSNIAAKRKSYKIVCVVSTLVVRSRPGAEAGEVETPNRAVPPEKWSGMIRGKISSNGVPVE